MIFADSRLRTYVACTPVAYCSITSAISSSDAPGGSSSSLHATTPAAAASSAAPSSAARIREISRNPPNIPAMPSVMPLSPSHAPPSAQRLALWIATLISNYAK